MPGKNSYDSFKSDVGQLVYYVIAAVVLLILLVCTPVVAVVAAVVGFMLANGIIIIIIVLICYGLFHLIKFLLIKVCEEDQARLRAQRLEREKKWKEEQEARRNQLFASREVAPLREQSVVCSNHHRYRYADFLIEAPPKSGRKCPLCKSSIFTLEDPKLRVYSMCEDEHSYENVYNVGPLLYRGQPGQQCPVCEEIAHLKASCRR